MTATFNCPSCNAPLDIEGDDVTIRCPYCQNSVIVPDELRPDGETAAVVSAQGFQVLNASAIDLGGIIGQASELKEILDIARSGNKIEAIKRYRLLTGMGLKESKDTIEALMAGRSVTVTSANAAGLLGAPEDQAGFGEKSAALQKIMELLQAGNKIEAIKLYRETFDTGLVEAKTAVERMEAGEFNQVQAMALQSTYVPQVISPKAIKTTAMIAGTTAGGIGCLGVLITLVILAAVFIPLLFALASPGGPLAGVWMQVNPLGYARLTSSFGGEGTGAGLFIDPRVIAVDGEGYIYVGEYSDGRIQRFSPGGEFQSMFNIGNEPYISGMAATREGTLYMVFRGKLSTYEGASGTLVKQLEDTYYESLALTADGKLVTIVESEEIRRLDRQGEVDLVVPAAVSSVSGDSELDAKVAVDGLGNIYVLGTFNGAVFKFSPQGKFINRFGGDGDAQGQFRAPSAIAVDGQGRIYVSDFKGIQVFDSDGRYLDMIDVDGFAFGMTFDNQGRLVVVTNTPKVYIYTINDEK